MECGENPEEAWVSTGSNIREASIPSGGTDKDTWMLDHRLMKEGRGDTQQGLLF